jgi:hypothetical protein
MRKWCGEMADISATSWIPVNKIAEIGFIFCIEEITKIKPETSDSTNKVFENQVVVERFASDRCIILAANPVHNAQQVSVQAHSEH